MASSTVRPRRPVRLTRDAPDPAEDGTPAPRPAARALRFMPPERRRGARDRRFGVGLSVVLHLVLFVVLVTTDLVRLPDLAALLEEPVASGGGEAVVYLPVEGFPGPRTSATPAPVAGEPAAPTRTPAPVSGIPPVPAPAGDAPRPVDVVGGSGSGTDGGEPSAGAGNGVERFNRAVAALRPRGLDPRLQPGSIDVLRTDHE